MSPSNQGINQPHTPPNYFIAHQITGQQVQEELSKTWRRAALLLPPGSSPATQDSPHITLRFLGPLQPHQDPDTPLRLQQTLSTISRQHQAIILRISTLSTFPGTLWAGVEGDCPNLLALHCLRQHVDSAVREAGFPAADFPYLPHITLATIPRKHTQQLANDLTHKHDPDPIPILLDNLELLHTIPHTTGAPGKYMPVGDPCRLGSLHQPF